MARRKVSVDFRDQTKRNVFPERKYGGCGAHEHVEPYTGPSTFDLKGSRHFRVTRVVSPTGSGVGSFRIDEVFRSRGEETIKARGFHCSYPDYLACVKVADNRII